MRSVLLAAVAALALTAPAAGSPAHPSAAWLAQARCIHQHEGPWAANTGNGYFGGMQFSKTTWLGARGQYEPALDHPGDPEFPFSATPRAQLRAAFVQWLHDGRTWKAWGGVGAACVKAHS